MEAKNIVKISNADEKFFIRFKPDPIYFRVSVYTLTLAIHSINAVVMILGFRGDAMNDPDVRTYYRFQYRFITCWTFVVQMIYAALGLYCDYTTLKKEETSKLKMLKIGREIIFSGLVVPTSFMVPTAFWALFLYDRNLILPTSMNKAISAFSNHIVHTIIVPIAVWEMIFLPRTVPNAHWINLLILMIFCIVYTTVLILTYFEMGMWPYPVMNLLEGTIYFHMFVWSCIGLLPFYYCLQWIPTRLLWSESRLARVKAD